MSKPSPSELAAASALRAELRQSGAIAAVERVQRREDEIAKRLRLLDGPKINSHLGEVSKGVGFKAATFDTSKLAGISSIMAGIDFSKFTGVKVARIGLSALADQNYALRQIVEHEALTARTYPVAARVADMTGVRKALLSGIDFEGLSAKMPPALSAISASMEAVTASLRVQGPALQQTRAALASFDTTALALQAQLRLATPNLTGVFGAYTTGLATAHILSAQIESAAVQLARSGGPWSRLPERSIGALAGLSTIPPLAATSPDDLMGVARGVYGLTAFAARAASMSGPEHAIEEGPDETVEEWSGSSLAADLRAALADLHPALAAKLEGAWDVYRRRGPDALGQAATSLVELIDRSMDLLAPNVELLAFADDGRLRGERYFTRDGNPTVALKLRFVLRERPITADALEEQIQALTRARKKLQRSKHKLDFSDDLLIGRLLIAVENVFTVILLG